MTQATASATDRRARFVGEEAYVAAGGRIERDLFADDAATRWLDIALLERLACEKMERSRPRPPPRPARLGPADARQLDRHAQTRGCGASSRDAAAHRRGDAPGRRARGEIEDLVDILEDEEPTSARREPRRRSAGSDRDRRDRQQAAGHRRGAEAAARRLPDPRRAGTARLDPASTAEAAGGQRPLAGSSGSERCGARSVSPRRKPAAAFRSGWSTSSRCSGGTSSPCMSPPIRPGARPRHLPDDRPGGGLFQREERLVALALRRQPVFGFKTPDAPATIARAEASRRARPELDRGRTRAERFDAFRCLPDERAPPGSAMPSLERWRRASTSRASGPARSTIILGQLLGIDVANGGGRPAPTISTGCRRA
jgi:ParB family chromosome partitioning protein